MFYSHTQARAKLPKQRRRVLPVEAPRPKGAGPGGGPGGPGGPKGGPGSPAKGKMGLGGGAMGDAIGFATKLGRSSMYLQAFEFSSLPAIILEFVHILTTSVHFIY